MIRKQFPDYELADNSILHYRDMKLVTFSIDRESHSLIISFPVFVKDFRQPPLKLYEVDMVAVPVPDRNRKADSYTKVRIHKPYLAAGEDYYIQLKMTELVMCKSIRYTYYCEELFVVKHKSRHSCASAIFYELGPAEVVNKCHFLLHLQCFNAPILFWMVAVLYCWPISMGPILCSVTPRMVACPNPPLNTSMQWRTDISCVTVSWT